MHRMDRGLVELAHVPEGVLQHAAEFGRLLLIAPLKDGVLFAVWLNGFTERTVTWRGKKLRVTKGVHLVIDRALCGSETLVVLLGRTGLACRTVTGASAELPTLLEWLERRKPCPPGLRDHVMRALAFRSADEPQAAAAVRELQVLMPLPRRHVASPDRPVGGDIDVAVSTGDGGLFAFGTVVAALVPIILALVAVAVGISGVVLLAGALDRLGYSIKRIALGGHVRGSRSRGHQLQ